MNYKKFKSFLIHEAEVLHMYPADLKKYMQRLFGILCALASYFFFSLSNVLTKCAKDLSMIDLMFLRQGAIFIVAIVYFAITRELSTIYHTNVIKKHFARGFYGYINSYLTLVAMIYLPVAEASSLSYTHGIFLILLTPIFLKSKVSLMSAIYVLIGFVGVMIITNPSIGSMNLMGSFYGLLAGLCLAFSVTYVKLLSETESVKTTLFYFAFITFLISCVPLVFEKTFMWNMHDVLYAILIGVIAAVAQIFLTISIFCVSPATTAIVSYSSMIWTTILGYLIWNEVPEWNFYVGSCFIIYAGVSSSLKKLNSAKQ